ncbi:MAG TPA: DUF4188 domain-containing protein [Ktedonobacteraceae bacterium]|nr:DUF4188 domain-containing protein [Ktedonobacteraceae bacterium]
MATVMRGRFTAQIDGPFVVFRLGVYINRFFLIWKWWPTLRSLLPIMRLLANTRATGLLHSFPISYILRGKGYVQYWQSLDDLEAFARDEASPYFELWRRYRESPGADGSVGIWYETFLVEPKKYEVVYDNMPVSGLAAASTHVPAAGRLETARRRLGRGYNEPAVPTPKD